MVDAHQHGPSWRGNSNGKLGRGLALAIWAVVGSGAMAGSTGPGAYRWAQKLKNAQCPVDQGTRRTMPLNGEDKSTGGTLSMSLRPTALPVTFKKSPEAAAVSEAASKEARSREGAVCSSGPHRNMILT